MNWHILRGAFKKVFSEMILAVWGWGMGLVLMAIFSLEVYLLYRFLGVYAMLLGALIYLVLVYMWLEVSYQYRNLRTIEKSKIRRKEDRI
ncbi:hypothetical protein [Calderihabitans maritimus]|uniref:Uncharacterized protein n=1 Tax=Calderihabitans maritimus TaxID=1246530 RepID=A0A1Z5HTX5_9FIRM|nr:hypothetical protein [Calderihabitans maritimus]GAW92986.1 hypothetical protein KKC1_21310 [Calderihabitans maritimus]